MPTTLQSIRGSTRLAFDLVSGVTTTVERMHETIARRPYPWSPREVDSPRGHGPISAAVYAAVRGVNGLIRDGVDLSLDLVPDVPSGPGQSRTEHKLMVMLNGVCGDYLERSGNPLAIDMHFATTEGRLDLMGGRTIQNPSSASGHIVLFVHGLCLSDRSWRRPGRGVLAERLRREEELSPIYLTYNSGRHISTNGRQLAAMIEQLVAAWPVPVKTLSLVGHSMGGLLIRSACWYGEQDSCGWLGKLRRVLCIGSPHHGAPLEKAGNRLSAAMRGSQYLDSLDLGSYRSDGIKDLRHGNLLDEDWQGPGKQDSTLDCRRTVPLLPGVDYYFVAATVGSHEQDPKGRLFGDLLVRTDSAFGTHSDPSRHIPVPAENCRIFHERNHFDLLFDDAVHDQVLAWFAQ